MGDGFIFHQIGVKCSKEGVVFLKGKVIRILEALYDIANKNRISPQLSIHSKVRGLLVDTQYKSHEFQV